MRKLFLPAATEEAHRAIDALDQSRKWVVEIKPHRKRRSLSQNALFHKWCQVIADETGESDPENTKIVLKDILLPKKVIAVGKAERLVSPGTSTLSVGEMAEFMTKVQAFAATQLGINLPSTDD